MHEIISILKNEESYRPDNYKITMTDYHPDSIEYRNWWTEQIRRCVEGYWYNGRYMPPQLYTYCNFGIIERLDDDNATSQKTTQPKLRDIEWLFFYNWLICRKFSGFELDNNYTCNKAILDPKFKKERASKYMLKPNGSLKEYVDPRYYLYMKHDKHLGKPIYENNALNLLLLTSRGCGKLLLPDAKIRVNKGWKKIKNIKIGDKVYGSDGKLYDVTNKTDLQKNVDIYTVYFETNVSVKCCADHQWLIYNDSGKSEVVTTLKLKEKLSNGKYFIPVSKKLSEIQEISNIRKATGIDNPDTFEYYASRGYKVYNEDYQIRYTTESDKIKISFIEYDGKGEGYCISVNSPDNTYITDNYIVTHNSYWGMTVSLHEFIFNSAISFDQLITELKGNVKTKVNCIITCELEDKANDLMNKVKTWYELMPGAYGQDDDYVPSPLYRVYTGSWNTKITQQIEKYYFTKDGNKAKRFEGSGSTLGIITFNKDPYKTAGKRNSVTVVEEIGLCTNLHTFWNANKDVQRVGKVKFGSTLGIGCVCAGTKVWTNDGRLVNIEDLKQEDGIIGYDGKQATKQTINWFKEPTVKPCYRITTVGNNIIECSEDHPFLKSFKKSKSSFEKMKNVYRCSYTEAKNLKIGDYLLTIDTVSIFGNTHYPHAYITGLMIGDGYFKGGSLSVDDSDIRKFITNNYQTSVRKEFITKESNLYTDFYIKNHTSLFKNTGLNDLTKEHKDLPYNIHDYDKKSLSEIIAGIFDSDGSIYYNKNKGTRIVLTNISEKLLISVKYQLIKFGIHCSIYKEKRNIKPTEEYKGQKDHIFRLYISKDIDVKKFIESIPLKHSKKIDSLKNFKKGNRDIGSGKMLFIHTNECEDEKFLENNKLLEGHKFEIIKAIEFIGDKKVYNLNVNNHHNYIANRFITGNTGGDIEKVQSSKRLFENPLLFDCLDFDDTFENTGKKIGLFIPAYLGNNDFKDNRGITDVEEAFAYYEDQRASILKNHGTSKDLDEEIMNRPIYPSEMFLNKRGNLFPIQELKNCLYNLVSDEKRYRSGTNGILLRDSSIKKGVRFVPDLIGEYTYIDTYPVPKEYRNDKNYLRGVLKVWEHPMEDSIKGIYKIGYDTVHYDFVENPESLISVLVYKGNIRFLSSDNNVYYDAIVAEFTGRYDLLDKNNEIVELISKYYNNAEIMMEVNIGVNIEYFKRRGLLHLLASQPKELLDKHIKHRQSNNMVGYIKSPELVGFLEQSTKEWLEKERGMTQDNKVIRNMDMINSKPLLEELIAYNREDNFDRINALFALMLAYKEENMDIADIEISDNKFMKSLLKAIPNRNKKESDLITLY